MNCLHQAYMHAICIWKSVHMGDHGLKNREAPTSRCTCSSFCRRGWFCPICMCSGRPLSCPFVAWEKRYSIFAFLQVKVWSGYFNSLQEWLHLPGQTLCEYVTGIWDKNIHVTLVAVVWKCYLWYFIIHLWVCYIFWINFPDVKLKNACASQYSSVVLFQYLLCITAFY